MSKEKLYSEDHIWVLYEDNIAVIGLSDYAQKQLGTLAFINLPEVGEKYQAGDVFGDVESIKTVSDLICPVDGEVVEVNESLIDNPENIDDTETSWLIKVCINSRPENLMNEVTYREKVVQL